MPLLTLYAQNNLMYYYYSPTTCTLAGAVIMTLTDGHDPHCTLLYYNMVF